MNDWSARQYLKFEDDRTRPSRDLLAQVPLDRAERVFDLGCGPGNSTELLNERFPDAEVIGVDSSADMLRQARERLPRPPVRAGRADDLEPAGAHRSVVRQCGVSVGAGPSGGAGAAAQGAAAGRRPRRADAGQHQRAGARADARGGGARTVRRSPGTGTRHRGALPTPGTTTICCVRSPAISTSGTLYYNHVMAGPQAIVEWFKGSALRPFLDALDATAREVFLADYTAQISEGVSGALRRQSPAAIPAPVHCCGALIEAKL